MAELSGFYSLVSSTCFTLVGLWWVVVQRHQSWRADPQRRRLAGGTYLSFLLPGLMSMVAQVAPENPIFWRLSFALASLVGLVSTTSLLVADRESSGYVADRVRVGPAGLEPARFGLKVRCSAN